MSSVWQPQWQTHRILCSVKKGSANVCFGCPAALSYAIFGVTYLGVFVLFLPIFYFPFLHFSLPFQPAKNLRNRVKDCRNSQPSQSCFGPFQEGKQCRKCLVGQACSRLLPFKGHSYAHFVSLTPLQLLSVTLANISFFLINLMQTRNN